MKRRSSSISRSLLWMNLAVSGVVLILAVLAFFSYDLLIFRQNLVRNLETSAQIVGENSVSAMLFDDPHNATLTLGALGQSPDVESALLVKQDGSIFAQYRRSGNAPMPERLPVAAGRDDDYRVSGSQVWLAHRIVFDNKNIGMVYVAARLMETGQQIRKYALISALILIVCFGAALIVSGKARRLVARPIMALADTAERVSREQDYSVRAVSASGPDEIEVLFRAFNQMLVQIHDRDLALQRSRDDLEERVQDRTAALVAANQELEAFSYTVAHDLRGPVETIMGLVYVIENLDDQRPVAECRGQLQQIRDCTSAMARLIDDLLNLSKAETVPLRKESVDLTAIVTRIAEDLRRADPLRRVDFRIAQVNPAEADAGLMEVALDNLVRNAWKYTSRSETARIEFGSTTAGGEVVYFVHDNGAGFDPALSDQIFLPFRRLHKQNEFTGTGVGLATVRRVVSRHGGRVWADGAVDKGATFRFTLGGSAQK
jgi:signal transduction histidine kinase